MHNDPLSAISPVDGRYHKQTHELSDYFSESALIRYRLRIEAEYFIALAGIPLPQLRAIDAKKSEMIREAVYKNFTHVDALRVKEIEKTTNHDVKAVEYVMKEKFDLLGLLYNYTNICQ